MHANEIHTDVALVRRLLAAQFPQWADRSIVRIEHAGTDNAIYRLGDDLAVRMPRIEWATAQVDKEHAWLGRLAPHLPLTIPVPLAKGAPAEGYPWNWSICPWLPGENATRDRLSDPHQAATDVANFILALQQVDPTGGPPAGAQNFGRGVPLAMRDEQTRAAIDSLHGQIDTEAATEIWDTALATPAWNRPPVWLHGDLQSGNLLAVNGRLAAVIDFGGLGVGDPACDLAVAWNLFDTNTRETFRAAMNVDDATWLRGRAWALSIGLIALPYYQTTNQVLAGISRYAISEVLGDFHKAKRL